MGTVARVRHWATKRSGDAIVPKSLRDSNSARGLFPNLGRLFVLCPLPVTEYFVVFALAVHPKHASDLAKPNMILGGGLYLSAREEIPESNSVGTFVLISNYSPNK